VIGVSLKGLAGRKLRAALTAIAIVLGVAMISGTYVLTDTIKAAFGTVFTQVYKSIDVIVTGKSAVGNGDNGALPPSFPASMLAKVRRLPGVAQADGGISDFAQLVGRDGKVISGHGAPPLAFSVHPRGNQRFNPLELVSGSWPAGPHEVVIDANTASNQGYSVGQAISVIARGPEQRFRIAGIVKIGGVSSLGGATMAGFSFHTAQRLFHKRGRLDTINVAAKPGTSLSRLVNEIRPLLPPTARVRTGQAQAQAQTKDTSGFLNIIQDFLLAFGGIALFVGSFVIANTLSITLAQRTRELATLRTLGASRRQVLMSVLVEALVIGAAASVVGLFLGLALGKGLNALFVSFGIDLPQAGLVFAARTVVVSLAAGVLITMLAALRPAIRTTRVPPISAVREGAVLPPSRFARFGTAAALLTTGVSVALMLLALLLGGLSTSQRLIAIGIAAVGVFLGVAMLARTLVPPLVAALGWPSARVGGSAGALARANAARSPSRTAATASALMIGLALVTLVAVLAAGLKTRFESSVNSLFKADYALTATDNFSPIPTAPAKALRRVPGVQVVSGVRSGSGRAFGDEISVSGVAPDISRVITVDWQAGSQSVPGELGRGGAFVSQGFADSHHLPVGKAIPVETPTGKTIHLAVRGIFAPPKGGAPYGDVTISTKRFDAEYQNPQNVYTFVDVAGGVNPANTQRLDRAIASYPNAKIQTEQQFKQNQEQGIDTLLNLLYVLLSLSIVVSLFGIVNTLVLTVFERTRELGMLRAVGMTRRQLRRMVRHESVITALIGAVLGIPLGIGFALIVGHAIEYPAFTVPVGTLLVFVVAAVVAGLLAAILPARRAGRLDVLHALQYE
jgi:putative ABC transport system permease protein